MCDVRCPWPTVLVPLALVAGACGRPPPPTEACEGRLPGDVVITELMRDPAGVDTGREYVELYNATGLPLELDGLELRVARADGSQERRHVLRGAPVLPPGGYVALGDAREGQPLPPHLGHAYGDALGALPNGEVLVSVRCGERLLDEVRLSAAGRTGTARELDGALPPDAVANDDEARFCDARTPYAEGALGSPGRANAPCAAAADGGGEGTTCTELESGLRRAAVAPAEGDLVVTEVMANPAVAEDASGEWLELHATRTVDLHGVTLGTAGVVGSALVGEGCMTVREGETALLARRADAAENGGLPRVHATFGQALSNAGGTLALRAGGTVVDALTYGPRGTAEAGVAVQLRPGRLTAADNDAADAWCDATAARPGGERGTPGAPNTECAGPAPDAGTEGCRVPGTTLRRAAVTPAPGDLVLNELMANPLGSDVDREYVELFVARSVDLNGLTLANGSTSGRTTLQSDTCLEVAQGSHVLLARRADAALNGGLPPPFATFGFSLGNAAAPGEPDRVVQLLQAATLLDEVRYRDSTEGVAAQLRPERRSPAANDGADAFCTPDEAPPYGEGGSGTPGAPNACP
jgi:Lamin Tail Domain